MVITTKGLPKGAENGSIFHVDKEYDILVWEGRVFQMVFQGHGLMSSFAYWMELLPEPKKESKEGTLDWECSSDKFGTPCYIRQD